MAKPIRPSPTSDEHPVAVRPGEQLAGDRVRSAAPADADSPRCRRSACQPSAACIAPRADEADAHRDAFPAARRSAPDRARPARCARRRSRTGRWPRASSSVRPNGWPSTVRSAPRVPVTRPPGAGGDLEGERADHEVEHALDEEAGAGERLERAEPRHGVTSRGRQLPRGEQLDQRHARDEAADVRHVGDAAALGWSRRSTPSWLTSWITIHMPEHDERGHRRRRRRASAPGRGSAGTSAGSRRARR